MPEGTGRYRNITPRVGRGERFGIIGQLPQTLRPVTPSRLQPKSGMPEEAVEFRRDPLMNLPRDPRGAMERRAVPVSDVYGSLEERIVYKELLRRHIPFDFQSSLVGPRRVAGAIIPDFLLLDRATIIMVDGGIWHQGLSAENRDRLQRDQLHFMGFEVYVIRAYEVASEQLTDLWFHRYIDVPVVQPLTLDRLSRLGDGRVVNLPTQLGVPLIK